MLKSVEHCHQHDIIHRDIKLENFLMDPRVNGKLVVKLCDFGLACHYSSDSPPTNKCGTILGLAPEMLNAKSYCHKIDVWGVGIILHELLTTQLPFYAEDMRIYK